VNSSLPTELQRPDVQRAIVRALARAYTESQDRHDPALGDDAMTFGIHVWKSGAFFLVQELADLPGASTEDRSQSLEILIERCRLRLHKLGNSELDNPFTSFPGHVGPATRMGRVVYEQLEFEVVIEEREVHLDWVIGHYGSADEGLRAIRFQAVGDERALDGTISRWEAIETVFDVSLAGTSSHSEERPHEDDEVVTSSPTVTLRPVNREEEGGGAGRA